MSDHEIVNDDDIQSFSTISSIGSTEAPCNESMMSKMSKKKLELLREIDSVNGNIWSFDSTKDDTNDLWEDENKTAEQERNGHNFWDDVISEQNRSSDNDDDSDQNDSDQDDEFDDNNTVLAPVEAESAVLKQLLTECQDYFKAEMDKAEQGIYQRMVNGMKSIGLEKPAEKEKEKKRVHKCRVEKLQAELQKLRLELEEAKEDVVPCLSFSASDISLISKCKNEMTVTNPSDKAVAVRLYVTHELYGCMRIDPSEFQLKGGQSRTIQVEYLGTKVPKRPNNMISMSLSFKWTNVPRGVVEDQKCPLQWMNDFPIRQYYVNLHISD